MGARFRDHGTTEHAEDAERVLSLVGCYEGVLAIQTIRWAINNESSIIEFPEKIKNLSACLQVFEDIGSSFFDGHRSLGAKVIG
jgi:hypothetical protein